MDKQKQSFFSKLFIFGEYTILHSKIGLAVPYKKYFGQWNFSKQTTQSNSSINKMLPFFKSEFGKEFEYESFKFDLEKGLFFDSNIPQGYGVGSSAALSAAIYDRYMTDKPDDISEIKKCLIKIESFYHGRSSGLDPLVSYLNQSIYLNDSKFDYVNSSRLEQHVFLIDTKLPRKTKPLVDYYLDRYQHSKLFRSKMEELSILNKETIELFQKEEENVFEKVKRISYLQYEYLNEMIPEPYKITWKESLSDPDYCIKLNGAGGGGFLMGYKRKLSFDDSIF